jgi:hypothetical protein
MLVKATKTMVLCAVAAATLAAITLIDRAAAQGSAPASLAGTYRCQPNSDPCLWSGQTPSIAQSGKTLEIKNEKGEVSNATLTSDVTISAGAPFNSLGIIRQDHSIDWSNGTKWQKQ